MFTLSLTAVFAREPKRSAGVPGTPAINSFNNVTCQSLGDVLQTLLEPNGRYFRPFKTVNGNPTLTFTRPDGYKTTYTFGGTMTHVALQPDSCRIEVDATAATPEEATKRNNLAIGDLVLFMGCRTAKPLVDRGQYSSESFAQTCSRFLPALQ